MCLNFLIVKIGCDNDNTIKVDTSITETVVNKVIENNVGKAGSDTVVVNTLNVTNNGVFDCPGGFNISQTSNINVRTINKVNEVESAQINTSMTNNVKDQLTQEQVTGILGFLNSIGQAGSVKNGADITQKVAEAVSNAVNQSIINEAWAGTFDTGTLNLTNNGIVEGGACNIVQSDAFDIRVTNLATTVQTTLQNDTFLNNLLAYVKQTQKSDDFSWVKWIFIAVIAVAVLLGLGLVLYFVFGGSKSKPQGSQSRQQLAEELRRKILERKEGGIASRSNLEGLERSAESRVGGEPGLDEGRFGGFEFSPEARQGYKKLANRFGGIAERFGKRFA